MALQFMTHEEVCQFAENLPCVIKVEFHQTETPGGMGISAEFDAWSCGLELAGSMPKDVRELCMKLISQTSETLEFEYCSPEAEGDYRRALILVSREKRTLIGEWELTPEEEC